MSKSQPHVGMRDMFFNALHPHFQKDRRFVFISADDGGPGAQRFSAEFPDRFINVGIAEEQMIGMASGCAIEGLVPITYAIAPFATLRCLEFIKLDMCAVNLHVINIGVGAGYSYDIAGPTHHMVEDISALRVLPNLWMFCPADSRAAEAIAHFVAEVPHPYYLRIDRGTVVDVYTERDISIHDGLSVIRQGKDLCIISTGRMVAEALTVAQKLEQDGISASVIDVFRLKPLNAELLLKCLKDVPRIVTYEEHQLAGGLGSLVAETLADSNNFIRMLRIGQKDKFVFDMGGREAIWKNSGLDAHSVTNDILAWLGSAIHAQALAT